MNDRTLAALCAEAYRTSDIEAGGAECIIRWLDDGAMVIAFRGTTFDGNDILTDLRALPRPSPIGWVHSGFWRGGKALFDALRDRLQAYQWYNATLTGHSKGGAEATVCAALARKAGYIVPRLDTFGSPRVGFSLGQWMPKVCRRHVYGNDPVPLHPWPLWGYRHVCDARQIGPERSNPPVEEIRDHRIARYVGALADN